MPAIKIALDGLWDTAWIDSESSFYYESLKPENPAPDLNLLIAPAYAWVYSMTGDEVYRTRGIRVFDGGVEHGSLTYGKHFSQAYRWSFDYLGYAATNAAKEAR